MLTVWELGVGGSDEHGVQIRNTGRKLIYHVTCVAMVYT